jgi:hypothetical protein
MEKEPTREATLSQEGRSTVFGWCILNTDAKAAKKRIQ